MNRYSSLPRSILYALPPIGMGTAEVESLRSYLCRLATAHGVSVNALSRDISSITGRKLSEKYFAHRASINGVGPGAQMWSAALAELTTIKDLERLTLLPWRNVVAQKGLLSNNYRWCPACFLDDRERKIAPYFRLAWDIKVIESCARHRIKLVHSCPHCQERNVLHSATNVIPGWCVRCGFFLGDTEHSIALARGAEHWKATEVAAMLASHVASPSLPSRENVVRGIQYLVAKLDHGKPAVFARRIGVGKPTVHHWLIQGGIPTLEAHLRMSSQSGLPLHQLLAAQIGEWEPSAPPAYSLTALFPKQTKRATPRTHDWMKIRRQLRELNDASHPISAAQAARQLGINVRSLYQNANREATALAARWRKYSGKRARHHRVVAAQAIGVACKKLSADEIGISLREIKRLVPREILGSVRKVIDLVQDAKRRL